MMQDLATVGLPDAFAADVSSSCYCVISLSQKSPICGRRANN